MIKINDTLISGLKKVVISKKPTSPLLEITLFGSSDIDLNLFLNKTVSIKKDDDLLIKKLYIYIIYEEKDKYIIFGEEKD